jgi:hypothetical protein
MSSIDTLFPQEKVLTIEGTDFVLREFHAREFPAVVAIASQMSGGSQEDIIRALEANGDRVLKLVAGITKQPMDVVERVRLPVLLRIIEGILEENIDFFVVTLPATLQRVTGRVTTAGSKLPNS